MEFPRKNWSSSTQVTRNLWKTSEMEFPDWVDVVLKKSIEKYWFFEKLELKKSTSNSGNPSISSSQPHEGSHMLTLFFGSNFSKNQYFSMGFFLNHIYSIWKRHFWGFPEISSRLGRDISIFSRKIHDFPWKFMNFMRNHGTSSKKGASLVRPLRDGVWGSYFADS